jgi:hypothetical protein
MRTEEENQAACRRLNLSDWCVDHHIRAYPDEVDAQCDNGSCECWCHD